MKIDANPEYCYGDPDAYGASLVDVLRWRADLHPQKVAFTFLTHSADEVQVLTYGDLDRRAQSIARLLRTNASAGDRALLLYPSSTDYIAAFFGCLYAGLVAVTAYPPRANRSLARLEAIAADADPRIALTTSSVFADLEHRVELSASLSSLGWIYTDHLDAVQTDPWYPDPVSPESIAFLQYTSGSTSQPKGVKVSHENILYNERMITEAFGHTEQDVIVGWLPLYHDMGLIGNVLQPIYVGGTCVMMTPTAFLQKPLRWLQAISDYGGTTAGGPNFAFDICSRSISEEDRKTLDLSKWSVAFCGAEPIRKETLEQFVTAFKPCGFRREAILPCYGLAEATLLVTGRKRQSGPTYLSIKHSALSQSRVVPHPDDIETDSCTLVGCGGGWLDEQISIRDPETGTFCPPDRIGEVWVSGRNVAQGYWNQNEETQKTFPRLGCRDNNGSDLRTGDLGFVRDGELFITGRLKDLIIIRGVNYYPQDIELCVTKSHDAIRLGAVAAFSVDINGEEQLVVVAEVERQYIREDLTAIAATIRANVSLAYDLRPYAVAMIKPGAIPKTSSGKIQRRACRQFFEAGSLEPLHCSVIPIPAADGATERGAGEMILTREEVINLPTAERACIIESYLLNRAGSLLKTRLETDDAVNTLNGLGLDSLMLITLLHRVEEELQVVLPVSTILESPSISALAVDVAGRMTRSPSADIRLSHSASAGSGDYTHFDGPLSLGQSALWFIQHMDPDCVAYNIARALRIDGDLDTPALRRAFQRLIARHDALRTTFDLSDGQPRARVYDDSPFHIEDVEATQWDDQSLHHWLATEANRPFDLAQGRLLRAFLVKRSRAEHVLLFVVHHIIVDYHSLVILGQELDALYKAEVEGVTKPPSTAWSYRDYVLWQQEVLADPASASLFQYWEEHLAGDLPQLDLPVDKVRPSEQSYNGKTYEFTLGEERLQRVNSVAKAEHTTPFSVLLAAFYVFLSRYTGQKDILVAVPLQGRVRAALEKMIGYFVNPVALRADLTGDPAFATFLNQVHQSVQGALAHQDIPFSALMDRLPVGRDLSRSSVAEVMFVWHQEMPGLEDSHGTWTGLAIGQGGSHMKIGNLWAESLPLEHRGAQFDLTLSLADVGGKLVGSVEYRTDLFEASTIERFVSHFANLLDGATIDPAILISQLLVLREEERTTLLEQFNSAAPEQSSDTHLIQIFEDQVRRSAEAVAIVLGDDQWTYAKLNAKANQLANFLCRQGIRPECLVGICLPRSIDFVISVIAVLKAGAAYVPLDADYPAERLKFLMESAPIAFVLERKGSENDTFRPSYVTQVTIDWAEIEREDQANIDPVTTLDSPFYAIFTSGSTGHPKAAVVSQRGFLNLVQWYIAEFRIDHSDRVLLMTSFSFDLTQKNIFAPLLVGGCVHLLPPAPYDPEHISSAIYRHGITLINCTPSTFYPLVEYAAQWQKLSSLKHVILGGEPIAVSRLLAWWNSPQCRATIVNSYGPTECTDVVAFHRLSHDSERSQTIPLGRPIRGTHLYVLDTNGQLVPIGVKGEICIGGVCVGKGYAGDPEMTARKFTPDQFALDPFAAGMDTRLYRSGDLARWRQDGNLEFLGRADHQLKIRGFRIEVEEIEYVLLLHEGVKDAAISPWSNQEGDVRLAAYLVPRLNPALHNGETNGVTAITQDGIRQYLSSRLPEYMVPSAFVFLAELPLSPNGKLNRQALPQPDMSSWRGRHPYTAPRTELERILAEVWVEVLGVDQVGIHDNFFEIGGDSLLSVRVAAKMNARGVSLRTQDLFAHQTIAGLASNATREPNGEAEGVIIKAAPLTPIQMRFFEKFPLAPNHYNSQFLATVATTLDHDLVKQTVEALSDYHDILRVRFVERDNVRSQELGSANFCVERHDLTILTELEYQDRMRSILESLNASIDLEQGAVLSIALIASEHSKTTLLIVGHHIIFDTVSWTTLFEDFWNIYGQLASGKVSGAGLPFKPVSYLAWANELQAYAESITVEPALAYWRSRPWDQVTPILLDFPENIDRATKDTLDGITTIVDEDMVNKLLETGKRLNVSVLAILQAAVALAFKAWLGPGIFCLETLGHGRAGIGSLLHDYSRTIGWFTTHAPFFVDARAAGNTLEYLQRIHEENVQMREFADTYGVLKYLSPSPEIRAAMQAHYQPVCLFKYDGIEQSSSRDTQNPLVEEVKQGRFFGVKPTCVAEKADFLLRINFAIIKGVLKCQLFYSSAVFKRATITGIEADFQRELHAFLRL